MLYEGVPVAFCNTRFARLSINPHAPPFYPRARAIGRGARASKSLHGLTLRGARKYHVTLLEGA
jgi:hypothetical protein